MSNLVAIRVSPSQIETYANECPRKWGLRQIDKLPAPQHPSAALGEAVHKVIEDWLRDGKAIDPGKPGPFEGPTPGQIAMPGVKHLPKPGVVEVETAFEFELGGVVYNGRRDGRWMDAFGRRVVLDNKTTGSFRWAKDEKTLATNIQAILYAKAELVEDPALESVDLLWLYLNTKKPTARPVRVTLTRAQIETEFAWIQEVAEEMAEIRRSDLRGLDLEPNTDSCEAFGGCPYKNNPCQLNAGEKWKAFMVQESMRDKMARRRAEKEAQAAKPAPVEDVEIEEGELVEETPATPGTGMCSCGTEAPVADGKLKPHKKPDGRLCMGGKAPLPAKQAEAANPVQKTSAPKVQPAAINPPQEQPEKIQGYTPSGALVRPTTSKPVETKAEPKPESAEDKALRKQEAAKAETSAPRSPTHDAMVLLILEAMDPAAVQRARLAVDRLLAAVK